MDMPLRNRRMWGPLALLLALWLVFVTTFGTHHDAEHAFVRHFHYGQACPVFDFCEHKNLASGVPAVVVVPLVAVVVEPLVAAVESLVTVWVPAFADARAPPVFS